MNTKNIIIGGSDIEFLNILSQNIKNTYSEVEVQTTNDAYYMYVLTREKKPLVLVSELIFPNWDWDGYLVMKLLKKDNRYADIPVVLILDKNDNRFEYILQDKEIGNNIVFKTDGLGNIMEKIKRIM